MFFYSLELLFLSVTQFGGGSTIFLKSNFKIVQPIKKKPQMGKTEGVSKNCSALQLTKFTPAVCNFWTKNTTTQQKNCFSFFKIQTSVCKHLNSSCQINAHIFCGCKQNKDKTINVNDKI